MSTHPLIRALQKLLSDADFHIAEAHDWCSMTFSGQRLIVECNPRAPDLSAYYKTLTGILPEHEFALPGLLVADIAVFMAEDDLGIAIEALVITE